MDFMAWILVVPWRPRPENAPRHPILRQQRPSVWNCRPEIEPADIVPVRHGDVRIWDMIREDRPAAVYGKRKMKIGAVAGQMVL
jgi:hypothetical protein